MASARVSLPSCPKRLWMTSGGYVYYVLNRAVARRFGWHEG